MNKLYISLVLFCVVTICIVSCSKDKKVVPDDKETVRALVEYTITPGDDPFTFNFTNKTTNYKELEWRFGDDTVSTEVSPSHVYLTDGIFQVNLKATAEDGSTSRKLLEINISADSVVKMKAVSNGGNAQKFSVDSKATIASLTWTFEDNSTSNDLTPVRTYAENTLNKVKVKMTTSKGSVVENSKFGTTKGIVSDVSTKINSLVVSQDNGSGKNAAEGSLKILDNKIDTKWYMGGWSFPIVATFTLSSAEAIKFYGIGSANDTESRDPKTWTLQGSNDGVTWEILDTRTLDKNFYSQAGNKFKQMFYYAIANPKAYQIYKWNVTANFGDGGFQISEFKIFK